MLTIFSILEVLIIIVPVLLSVAYVTIAERKTMGSTVIFQLSIHNIIINPYIKIKDQIFKNINLYINSYKRFN
jgi:hypothetical protein